MKSGLALGLRQEDDVFVVENPYVDCLRNATRLTKRGAVISRIA